MQSKEPPEPNMYDYIWYICWFLVPVLVGGALISMVLGMFNVGIGCFCAGFCVRMAGVYAEENSQVVRFFLDKNGKM